MKRKQPANDSNFAEPPDLYLVDPVNYAATSRWVRARAAAHKREITVRRQQRSAWHRRKQRTE